MKTVCGEKYYGRYMDDIYIISESKEHLSKLLCIVKKQLSDLKLEVNERKTHITKLTHGFTFLQIKYSFNGNRIIKRLTHEKIVRERRRLKAFKRLVVNRKMTEIKAYNCYKSWRQSAVKDSNACRNSIQNMDKLFRELFPNCKTKDTRLRSDFVNLIFSNIEEEDIVFMYDLMRRDDECTTGFMTFALDV